MQKRASAIAALLFAAAGPAPAETKIGGEATLATDYVFRGVSQTLSEPALQGLVSIEHDSGVSGYAWASNVDLADHGDPDDGARVEIDLAVQYGLALSERLAVSLGRIQYVYPGTNPGFDYDYGEWVGEITLDGRHRLALAWSDDIFAGGVPGWYAGVATAFELPAQLTLELQAGHVDLQRLYGESYAHASLALSGRIGAFDWEIACHASDASARDVFYESAVEPRVVLSVTYGIPTASP